MDSLPRLRGGPARVTLPRFRTALLSALLLLAPAAVGQGFTAGHLFVCSEGSDAVLELDADGTLVRALGAGAGLDAPAGLAFDARGVLWVASSGSDRLLGFDGSGALVAELGAGSGLISPHGVAVGPTGHLFTGDLGGQTVLEFSPDGPLLATWGADAGLLVPSDLAFGADGHLFVASAGTGRVTELDASGAVVRELGADSSLVLAIGLAFGNDGRLRVSSGAGDSVVLLDAQGAQSDVYAAEAGLDGTAGLAFGPDGHLYVACRDSGLVTVLDAEGAQVRQLGADAGLLLAGDLAFAPRRFPVTLSGELTLQGVPPQSFKQTGVLSCGAGSLELGLALNGIQATAAAQTPLAALLGGSSLLLRGFEGRSDDPAQRVLQGTLCAAGDAGPVTLSLVLQASGTVSAAGACSVTKAKGELWGGAAGGQVRAAVKLGKPLN